MYALSNTHVAPDTHNQNTNAVHDVIGNALYLHLHIPTNVMPSPPAWRLIRPRANSEDRSTSFSRPQEPNHSPTSAKAPKPPRIKVSSACFSCKHKKCRCDGRQPCFACVTRQIECRYDETSDMRRNRVSRNVSDSLSHQIDTLNTEKDSLADDIQTLTERVEELTADSDSLSERTSLYVRLLEVLSTAPHGQALELLARLRGYLETSGPENPDPLLKATRLTLRMTLPKGDPLARLLETDDALTSTLSTGMSWQSRNLQRNGPVD